MSEEGQQRSQPNLDFDTKRVYVGNLSFKTSWQELKDFFNEQIGNVSYADVLTDSMSGKSKGCGVVEFASNEDAKKAVKQLQGVTLEGREIFLREDRAPTHSFSRSRGRGRGRGRGFRGRGRGFRGGFRREGSAPKRTETGGGSGRQIYVGNLSFSTEKSSIQSKFSEFGTVNDVTLELDQRGRSKGWATVLFETKEQADAAVAATDGVEFEGRPLVVHVDKYFSETQDEEAQE